MTLSVPYWVLLLFKLGLQLLMKINVKFKGVMNFMPKPDTTFAIQAFGEVC